MKRRNLSGIYIFDKFEGEATIQPTCIEDCTEETRTDWIEDLDKEPINSFTSSKYPVNLFPPDSPPILATPVGIPRVPDTLCCTSDSKVPEPS